MSIKDLGIKDIIGLIPADLRISALALIFIFLLISGVLGAFKFLDPETRKLAIRSIIFFILPGYFLIYFSASAHDVRTGLASSLNTAASVIKMGRSSSDTHGRDPLPAEAAQELGLLLEVRSRSFDPPDGIDDAIAKLRDGDPQPALNILRKDNDKTAETLRGIGLLEFYKDTQGALNAYEESVKLDPDNWVAWYQIALLRERISPATAEQAAHKALDIAKRSGDANALGSACAAFGVIARDRGQFETAIDYFEKSRGYFLTVNAKASYALVTNSLARAYFADGHYDTAVRSYQDSLSTDTALANARGKANDFIGLGDVAVAQGKYPRAIEFYQSAITIGESLSDLYELGLAEAGISRAYEKQHDLDNAQKFREKALADERQLQNPLGESYDEMGLGDLAVARGDHHDAEQDYKLANTIAIRARSPFAQAVSQRALAKLYLDENRPSDALALFQQAQRLDKGIDRARYAALDQLWIGQSYSRLSQNSKACAAWEDAEHTLASDRDKVEVNDYLTEVGTKIANAHCQS
jgi:tetratricopeptide (TPR) repeat protein